MAVIVHCHTPNFYRAGGAWYYVAPGLIVFRMIKRRVKAVGLGEANRHTFRATGITAYLLHGGTLERAQAIAAPGPSMSGTLGRLVAQVRLGGLDFRQLAQAVRAENLDGAIIASLGRVRAELAVEHRPGQPQRLLERERPVGEPQVEKGSLARLIG